MPLKNDLVFIDKRKPVSLLCMKTGFHICKKIHRSPSKSGNWVCNILHSQPKLLSTVYFQCDTCLFWYTLSFALLQFLSMSYSMLVGLTVKSGQTPSNFNYALHVLIGQSRSLFCWQQTNNDVELRVEVKEVKGLHRNSNKVYSTKMTVSSVLP